jgi:beta-N-acetylhexosaminidase
LFKISVEINNNTKIIGLHLKSNNIMIKIFLSSFLIITIGYGCAQTPQKTEIKEQKIEIKAEEKQKEIILNFELKDYLSENQDLTNEVLRIFNSLDDTSIVAQLIMPAAGRLGLPKDSIMKLINKRIIGGMLMLNGTKEEFTSWIKSFEKLNKEKGNLPFLYSADAEPSLVNKKIIGSAPVKKAAETMSIEEVIATTLSISKDLNEIGINYNFAPVVDVAGNATVGYRGFGSKPEQLKSWSLAFIENTQKQNIVATAKHFPGHGLVSGDTHKELQTINGEMLEVKNYPALIENGVLSIMIAHIAVRNNAKYDTQGLPSTLSEKIVTRLLRDSLGFKGLIVTDAMNMGGVRSVPLSSSKAVRAGCDIVLMPADVTKTHTELLNLYRKDPLFKQRVDESAKRIIRMKIALGLIKPN